MREIAFDNNGQTKSVFVAIIGRPNVGKSSLLNRLVGEKAAIVTPKPQTTRTRITGILTKGPVQFAFFDTPGIHQPHTKLGGRMMKTAEESVSEGDVTLMLFDPAAPLKPAEEEMVRALKAGSQHAVAAINKIDNVRLGEELAKRKAELEELGAFEQVFPISAQTGEGCDALLEALAGYAMDGPHYFDDDAYTDQPEKQLVAEIIREKLLLFMQEEIPHGTAVEVDSFKERGSGAKAMVDIEATIYCERKSHKGMIIGKGGAMLKQIGTAARQDCEALLGVKVNLQCWVKVRGGWRDDEKMLGNMGFGKG